MAHNKALITYNPAEVLSLEWVTENFRVIGDFCLSPIIHPIPKCGEQWCIGLVFNEHKTSTRKKLFEISLLRKKSSIEKCYLELSSLTIQNEFVCIHPPPIVCIEKEKCYLLFAGDVSQDTYYQSKKLTVKVQLTVSGYRVSYSASPRPVIHFETNCQDLLRDLKSLYGDSNTADLTFLVGGQKLFAHSSIIRCRSIVFAKMLDQDMLERRTRCISITDADFQVFDCFLMYLYTAKLKDKSWNTVYYLYSLAEKYAVSGLKKTCSCWLSANLNVDTVSKCIALAAFYEDKELKDEAKQFIRDNLGSVFETFDWKYIVSNQPQLASEVLSFATAYSGVRQHSIKFP
ncbi:unnamed protein product [Larinioides sclopetarius]|uniref:BTB domain-containing protein n=1 Tax=Larinioides sclopetarius TaxID=280406 RepID=A0AAV1YRL7_9ARAC